MGSQGRDIYDKEQRRKYDEMRCYVMQIEEEVANIQKQKRGR